MAAVEEARKQRLTTKVEIATATGAETIWVTHGREDALVHWCRQRGLDAERSASPLTRASTSEPQRIVVPITGWKDHWATTPWLIHLRPSSRNGLNKPSAADAFQAKSPSIDRFQKRLGELKADEVEQIAAAICLCVGA